MSDIVLASAHTSLTLFLVISDWRSRTSLAPAWITILLNLRLALASTFKFAKMSGALAPGKQWTMVAGVSIFTFRTIESPITRALSPGFSVGASLSGENLSGVLTRDYAASQSPSCPAAQALPEPNNVQESLS